MENKVYLSKANLNVTKVSCTFKIHAMAVLLRICDSNLTKVPNLFNGQILKFLKGQANIFFLKKESVKFRENSACFQTKINALL